MHLRSFCCCILLASLLGVPALAQTSSPPTEQPAPGTSPGTQASPTPPMSPQSNTTQSTNAEIRIARTTEDIRERMLLDRIDQLEKRVEELEARSNPSAAAPSAQNAAPAATPEASPPTWSIGPIDFSGLVDGYFDFNANHPASMTNQ